MAVLAKLSDAISALAAQAGPSIVGIGSRQRGSGVVIAANRVLTNAHNLRGDGVTVRFADGRTARGRVAGADADGDLAVVDVDTADVPALAWSAVTPTIGTAVFSAAAASPAGTRLTFGFVSSVGRTFHGPGGRPIAGAIEHTAPLAPGSSGSAVLDDAGALLGLNTHRIGEGFYLAMPADAAFRARVEALARGEVPHRPRLGIAVAPAHVARRLRRATGLPDRDGVLVREVEPGGPAERAGIAQGDLVVAVGGVPTPDVDDLHAALDAALFPLVLSLVRGAGERTVTVEAAPEG